MKSIKPIDDELEFTLQVKIKENLHKIKKLIRAYNISLKMILPMLAALKLDEDNYDDDGVFAGEEDINKISQDIISRYNNNVRDVIEAVSDIYTSVIQLGNTIDLDAFSKKDVKERYYSDGYLQCFADIYNKFRELRSRLWVQN